MYFRRLRTLADKVYSSNEITNKFIEYENLYDDEMNLDIAKWPAEPGFSRVKYAQAYNTSLAEIKRHLLVLHRHPWAIPAAQTDLDRQSVSLAEVVPDANNANEYIRLQNDADTAVDVSEWFIEGINYTLPAGAVIPANGSLYVLRDDAAYRAGHPAVLVAGQYDNDLGGVGTLILKTDTGSTIDTENY